MVDYDEYERLFNVGDDVGHTERFFTDDIAFIASSRVMKGKEELYKFLAFAHDGVMERMRPQKVVNTGDFIFAEVDMDFHATKERPEFPFGHMHPGDCVTVKFFVTYRVVGDKIDELKAMTWAPEKGVSKIARLGAHPSQQAAFKAYLAAFSNADYDRFSAFYAPDVTLELGSVPPLKGKQAIVDFYGKMFPVVRESIQLDKVTFSDTEIDLEATATFTAIKDAPDFVVSPLKQGERVSVPVRVRYALENGLIKTIGVSRLGDPKKAAA